MLLFLNSNFGLFLKVVIFYIHHPFLLLSWNGLLTFGIGRSPDTAAVVSSPTPYLLYLLFHVNLYNFYPISILFPFSDYHASFTDITFWEPQTHTTNQLRYLHLVCFVISF